VSEQDRRTSRESVPGEDRRTQRAGATPAVAQGENPGTPALLREGETCWRLAPCSRAAFLVDGEAYFGAVAEALEHARERVWLIGWDFHSEARLRHDDGPRPERLLDLLQALVAERPALRVNVLGWDYSLIYAAERELRPLLGTEGGRHRSIEFVLDGAHPLTACQHQKLVVIDDAVAFVGGFDLTSHRWDTREHRASDPRRVTPAGAPYAPFHDVQMCVDGEAAAVLAELARERWLRATGRRTQAVKVASDPWPRCVEPDLRDTCVGVVRTVPSCDGRPEVREVEALYRESIAAAQRWIYIENQYLTSGRIADWLAARLREPRGPEIVVVGPRRNAGWLEESTMGALRDRAVRALRSVDEHDRLRVLYPHVPGLADDQVLNVHAKVMVVDDDLVRVGSSNLSNRSLGLDSECDLAIEASGREPVRRRIAAFRADLLAEHLGVERRDVELELARTGSLVATIEALGGRARTLCALELDAGDWQADTIAAFGAVDPEHSFPLEELVERFEADAVPERMKEPVVRVLGVEVFLGSPAPCFDGSSGDVVQLGAGQTGTERCLGG